VATVAAPRLFHLSSSSSFELVKNTPYGGCAPLLSPATLTLVTLQGRGLPLDIPLLLKKDIWGEMIRVLLVDDNTEYARVFSVALDLQPDIKVVGIAGTLAEARAMLEGVDVAILDRVLPDGDGLELISELRKASPNAKVLVMSAFTESSNPQEALEAGADRVLGKLVPPDEVFTTIRELRGEG
jgi:CheY-like chemotaxis protein